MEKTTLHSLRLLLLVTIITGSFFILTACGPEIANPQEVAPLQVTEEDAVKKEESAPVIDVKTDAALTTKVEVTPTIVVPSKVPMDPKLVDTAPEPKVDTAPAAEPTPTPTPTPTPKAETPPAQETQPVVNLSTFVDGTYTKTGGYTSPGGAESVTVTVSVQDDVIKSVSAVGNGNNDTSKSFQGLFTAGVGDQVIGKKLVDLSVGTVNGSSLTGGGFNSAIASIKAQAMR